MIRRRQTPPPVLLYAELGRSQARAGEREAITWCIRSPSIWRNDNSDSDRSRPFVLNANGSRPSECRWQLREVGLWRLSRCNSSENRERGNQTHSMAPLTAALEKNCLLWQTLDLISFELHAADQAQWVGAAQASDQRSLITPEARGHHEVIMRSSPGHHRPGAWSGPGKYLMWMITVWRVRPLLSVYLITRDAEQKLVIVVMGLTSYHEQWPGTSELWTKQRSLSLSR